MSGHASHPHGAHGRDLSALSEEELYELHVFHRVDHDRLRRKYEGLYGHVQRRQDAFISRYVLGRSVLDVGAGYGWTTLHLRERSLDVTPVDLHQATREYARRWYGVDVLHGDVYALAFPDRSFDTVLLREVSEHVEFDRAVRELTRTARRAIILFQTNVSPLVRWLRGLAAHHEFSSPPLSHYAEELRRVGWRVDVVRYRDVFAFPLSGALVTRQWFPPLPALYPAVVAVDDAAAALARAMRFDRALCWRVLIRAVPG